MSFQNQIWWLILILSLEKKSDTKGGFGHMLAEEGKEGWREGKKETELSLPKCLLFSFLESYSWKKPLCPSHSNSSFHPTICPLKKKTYFFVGISWNFLHDRHSPKYIILLHYHWLARSIMSSLILVTWRWGLAWPFLPMLSSGDSALPTLWRAYPRWLVQYSSLPHSPPGK